LFILAELLVVAAGIFHALNGLRIVLTSFNIGVGIQKQLFVGIFLLSTVAALIFAVRMFMG
jgi:succinate dehydrogenase/fumarate reductase cytochrome b subunit